MAELYKSFRISEYEKIKIQKDMIKHGYKIFNKYFWHIMLRYGKRKQRFIIDIEGLFSSPKKLLSLCMSEDQLELLKNYAKKNNFSSVSLFVRWMLRKYGDQKTI